jgi:hypothetical protein
MFEVVTSWGKYFCAYLDICCWLHVYGTGGAITISTTARLVRIYYWLSWCRVRLVKTPYLNAKFRRKEAVIPKVIPNWVFAISLYHSSAGDVVSIYTITSSIRTCHWLSWCRVRLVKTPSLNVNSRRWVVVTLKVMPNSIFGCQPIVLDTISEMQFTSTPSYLPSGRVTKYYNAAYV